MNLLSELNKINTPAPCKSDIRTLSGEEIQQLVIAGEVTPLDAIPEYHYRARLCFPASSQRFRSGRIFQARREAL